jgi:hypothetical protein
LAHCTRNPRHDHAGGSHGRGAKCRTCDRLHGIRESALFRHVKPFSAPGAFAGDAAINAIGLNNVPEDNR